MCVFDHHMRARTCFVLYKSVFMFILKVYVFTAAFATCKCTGTYSI
jgi:hypothetical protein